jgi:hypothetical protein
MAFKPRQVVDKLTRELGFERIQNRGDDHIYYAAQLADDLPVIEIHFQHSGGEIGPNLEATLAKELHVSQGFFRSMVSCKKNLEQYIEVLRTNPNPPFPPWMMKRVPKEGKK